MSARSVYSRAPVPFYQDMYIIVNYAVFLSYVVMRICTDLFQFPDVSNDSYVSMSKEYQLYILTLLILVGKYRRCICVEQFIYDAVFYLRIAVLTYCYFGFMRAFGWYLMAFVVFGITVKKDVFHRKTGLPRVTGVYVTETIEKDLSDTMHVVFVHSANNEYSQHVHRQFDSIACRHSDLNAKYYSLNITTSPEVLLKHELRPDAIWIVDEKYGILANIVNNLGLGIPSKDLPSVLCYRQGKLVLKTTAVSAFEKWLLQYVPLKGAASKSKTTAEPKKKK